MAHLYLMVVNNVNEHNVLPMLIALHGDH